MPIECDMERKSGCILFIKNNYHQKTKHQKASLFTYFSVVLGPKYSSLTICHWNLDSLTAHNSIKISSLQAYVTQHNYDIICLSETFLNSIDSSDRRILIDGYNLTRSDHPSDSKTGRVCIYYKGHIPLTKRDNICILDNCLVTEIRSQIEKCFLTCIFRSPSQNNEEFESFAQILIYFLAI